MSKDNVIYIVSQETGGEERLVPTCFSVEIDSESAHLHHIYVNGSYVQVNVAPNHPGRMLSVEYDDLRCEAIVKGVEVI